MSASAVKTPRSKAPRNGSSKDAVSAADVLTVVAEVCDGHLYKLQRQGLNRMGAFMRKAVGARNRKVKEIEKNKRLKSVGFNNIYVQKAFARVRRNKLVKQHHKQQGQNSMRVIMAYWHNVGESEQARVRQLYEPIIKKVNAKHAARESFDQLQEVERLEKELGIDENEYLADFDEFFVNFSSDEPASEDSQEPSSSVKRPATSDKRGKTPTEPAAAATTSTPSRPATTSNTAKSGKKGGLQPAEHTKAAASSHKHGAEPQGAVPAGPVADSRKHGKKKEKHHSSTADGVAGHGDEHVQPAVQHTENGGAVKAHKKGHKSSDAQAATTAGDVAADGKVGKKRKSDMHVVHQSDAAVTDDYASDLKSEKKKKKKKKRKTDDASAPE